MAHLSTGSTVSLPMSRRVATVGELIGEGSQGAVFQATVEGSPTPRALKWYSAAINLTQQRQTIEDLIERGAPDSRFLWPIEVAELAGTEGFGYVMPLRPDTSVSLADLLTGRVDVPLSIVCQLGAHLADCFLALHSQGLCYRDISFGNIFFDRTSGSPLICDNDNVGVDGTSPTTVLGTRRFMAPEIVRREATPSTATDLYSLSVLLFYLLMVGHPLVGRRELEFTTWDEQAESVLFGKDPRFVFDPQDRTNEPLPELHGAVLANWAIYPAGTRDLFVKAFTRGLNDPVNGRVRESVWRSSLSRLRDQIISCRACGRENFWDAGAGPKPCWSCGRESEPPTCLDIEGRMVVLEPGTVIRPHHLGLDYDFESVIAEVVPHPTKPDRWGLCNRTGSAWEVKLRSGELMSAEPGRSVGLIPDTVVDIGGTRVRIDS